MNLGKLINYRSVKDLTRKGYVVVRISQLGRCHRSLMYSMLGIKQEEAPKKTKLMWEDRLLDEERIVRKLKKKFNIKYSGEEQKTLSRVSEDFKEKIILSCTPDGLVEDDEYLIPLEIKSLNPFRFESIKNQESLSREYLIQVHGEMLLSKAKKALYVIGNSKTKEDIKHFFINFDERILPWIKNRISYVLSFQKSRYLIYPEYLPDSEKCHWCLYKERCKKDVYKRFDLIYNKEVKIRRDDFEYDRIKELSNRIITSREELSDIKFSLVKNSHELKDLFLKNQAGKFKHGKISLKEVNKILGGRS